MYARYLCCCWGRARRREGLIQSLKHPNVCTIYVAVQRKTRLWVVPEFSSRIVERAKRERTGKSPHARKATRGTFLSPHLVTPFCVEWFSRALSFRSIFYPWGKWDYSWSILYSILLSFIFDNLYLVGYNYTLLFFEQSYWYFSQFQPYQLFVHDG